MWYPASKEILVGQRIKLPMMMQQTSVDDKLDFVKSAGSCMYHGYVSSINCPHKKSIMVKCRKNSMQETTQRGIHSNNG